MNEDINVSWMNETIEELPEHQGMYKLFCLIQLKRRMTYSDMYVFTYALNKNKYKNNDLELKERIIKDLVLIYYYNNKKLPYGFEFTRI